MQHWVATQCLQDSPTVYLRHHNVQHDCLRSDLCSQIESFLRVGGGKDLVARVGDKALQQSQVVGVVINHHHRCAAHARQGEREPDVFLGTHHDQGPTVQFDELLGRFNGRFHLLIAHEFPRFAYKLHLHPLGCVRNRKTNATT